MLEATISNRFIINSRGLGVFFVFAVETSPNVGSSWTIDFCRSGSNAGRCQIEPRLVIRRSIFCGSVWDVAARFNVYILQLFLHKNNFTKRIRERLTCITSTTNSKNTLLPETISTKKTFLSFRTSIRRGRAIHRRVRQTGQKPVHGDQRRCRPSFRGRDCALGVGKDPDSIKRPDVKHRQFGLASSVRRSVKPVGRRRLRFYIKTDG
jgi:hypothetical protein